MDKYKYSKDKLEKLGVFTEKRINVTDEETMKEYDSLLKQGKELPEGIKRRESQTNDRFEEISKRSYYLAIPLTDEQIKAKLETKNTKYLRTIAHSLTFFVIITVIGLVIMYLGILLS